MEKPYDEVFVGLESLSNAEDWLNHSHRTVDYFMRKFQADEVEVIHDRDRMGLMVKYKRNQLQYG